MILGVDFDGKLSFAIWPEVGQPNTGLIEFLITRRKDGAVSWCMEMGLQFDAINDNLPEVMAKYVENSRKISCDFYTDDRAMAVCICRISRRKLIWNRDRRVLR